MAKQIKVFLFVYLLLSSTMLLGELGITCLGELDNSNSLVKFDRSFRNS
jgi:hypothetical protein